MRCISRLKTSEIGCRFTGGGVLQNTQRFKEMIHFFGGIHSGDPENLMTSPNLFFYLPDTFMKLSYDFHDKSFIPLISPTTRLISVCRT
jgi:hypothetical protein